MPSNLKLFRRTNSTGTFGLQRAPKIDPPSPSHPLMGLLRSLQAPKAESPHQAEGQGRRAHGCSRSDGFGRARASAAGRGRSGFVEVRLLSHIAAGPQRQKAPDGPQTGLVLALTALAQHLQR